MNENFDFVAVGSGGGAMCAALVMRAAGKSVLILEKADQVGGTTAVSGGVMWIPNNRFMKAEGIQDSREDAIAYLDAAVGDSDDTPGASRERRETYVDKAPEMVDFLVERGVRLRRVPSWPDYQNVPGASIPGRTVVSELFDIKKLGEWKDKLRPGFIPMPAYLEEAMELPDFKRSGHAKKVLARVIGRTLWSRLTGKHLVTAGQALQGQMLNAALEAGVEIRTNTGVRELLVEDGRVTGVAVEKDGSEWHIGATCGVLINAGGFARNQEMLDQYIPGTSTEWSNTTAGDTGDMIREGQRLGAAVAQMEERIGNPVVLPPDNPDFKPAMQSDLPKPHAILVDQTGERYLRESSSYAEICNAMRERNKEAPAVPSWIIVDSRYLEKYMLAGTMPGKKKPASWLESGFLRKADTLEELARAGDIDPEKLKATVERFNDFVRQGRDEDFHRGDAPYDRWLGDALHEPNETLGTLEEGPFYALPVYPGDVSTFGGLVTDENARVLREDGSAIPGLYATGTSTASVMGRGSPGAGASIGPAFTWGYVAAQHAASADDNE